jgi:hypothetical protein
MRHALSTVSVLGALLATGCAFGNRHATLMYPPAVAPRVAKAAPVVSANETALPTVVVVPLLDQRPNKTAIGAVHNGFGMHTADVLANNSVPEWVTNAIASELRAVGFNVVVAQANDAKEAPLVTGEVLTVYCPSWTKYEADVSFAVRVVADGKALLSKTYQGKNDSTTNWGASSKSYAQALAVALQSAAQSFAAELRRDIGVQR